MLIRTPPEQALPVYECFLRTYPDVQALCAATVSDVHSVIGSLGLRWRAERLVSMGTYIVEECGGCFPDSAQALERVPGIGPYAAAAIMLFYYRRRGVLVDSNSVRFVQRYYGRSFPGEARRNREVIRIMDELTPRTGAAAVAFASGFLDLMRTVCRPGTPVCGECPVADSCHHQQGAGEICSPPES